MRIVTFLEDNTVYNEDCMLGMRAMPDGCVDMVLCDLPYGTTQNKWDSVLPLPELWATYWRLLKPECAIVLSCTQPFTSALAAASIRELRYEWIWKKNIVTGHLNAHKRPMRNHESVLVFARDSKHTYNPQGLRPYNAVKRRGHNGTNFGKSGSENFQEFTNYPTTVLEIDRDPGKSIHPTQKPVDLFEYLIRTYTQPGQLVLDNCMGSGTTAVAAIRTGRRFIGFETDPKFFSITNERIAKELAAVVDPQPLTE